MIDHEQAWVVAQWLKSLQRAGVTHLPKVDGPRAALLSPGHNQPSPVSAAAASPPAPMPAPVAPNSLTSEEAVTDSPTPDVAISSAATLEVLAQEVAGCTLCDELAATRTQTVFADGNPQARLVFLGEAPGADEDAQGVPFVGRAGKLLTDIIQNGMKLNRQEDVYIMNILKCRPPGNRNPHPVEADNCQRYLLRQFDLVEPEYICCLGAVAAQNLLDTTTPIGKLRGKFHDWRGIQVMCTYHPAYLLRNPPAKKQTWEDIQMLMRAMGLL